MSLWRNQREFPPRDRTQVDQIIEVKPFGQMLSEVMDRLDDIDKSLDNMLKQLDELRVAGLAMPERIRKHLDDSAMLVAGGGARR